MSQVEIYTKDWCSYCARAKALLQSKDVGYTEIEITNDAVREAEMVDRAKRRSVPQIFINNVHVGGFDDLAVLASRGELDGRKAA